MSARNSSDDRPLLLVIATGMQPYREYLFSSISTRFRIHLFHIAVPQWETRYLSGWTVLPDTWDGPAMAAAAVELNRTEPIDGVLCWDEGRIHAASHVAQALGLRGGDPAAVWRVRDKGQTRAALAAAGVAQPRSVPVKTLEQALAAAQRVGYPAILKPRGYGASVGVVRVEDPADLRERFAFTSGMRLPDPVMFDSDLPVLVEECVTGEEISIDSVVRDGRVSALYLARKVVGYPPYAEEVGHYVDGADPLLADRELLAALQEAHTAVGFRDGWTHTEFMLTAGGAGKKTTAGGPKLIEINGRLGGDMIPYLGLLATGIDPGLVAAAAACGLPPDLTPPEPRRTGRRVAGVRFFYAEQDDTTIGSVSFDRTAVPPDIDRAIAVAQPGAVVSPPPKGTVWGRIAFAIADSCGVPECARSLDAAQAALEVEIKQV
jgi:hypothetical protein